MQRDWSERTSPRSATWNRCGFSPSLTRLSNTDPQSSGDLDAALDRPVASDDQSSQLNALWNLWIVAADSGVPSEALHALESIRDAPGVDARVQREADLALEDLARLVESLEPSTHSPAREDEPLDSFDREYAMMQAAAKDGWLDGEAAMIESLLAFKRAGAAGVLTYFAPRAAALLKTKS